MDNKITVIAITLNEEHNLADFISNLKDFADDIIILDSFSKDKTVDIAVLNNVKIFQRRFRNFGDQWNAAISLLPINSGWVMKLDPDERLDGNTKFMIKKIINQGNVDGIKFNRRLWLFGKRLNITQEVTRVWRHGKCKFTRVDVNELPIIDGKILKIKEEIQHLDSPNLHHWNEKQNRYTTSEAKQLYDLYKKTDKKISMRSFFIKLFIYVPLRYQFLFAYFYLFKMMFFSGRDGWLWSKLRTEVYYMIEVKYKHLLKNRELNYNMAQGSGAPDKRCEQLN